MSNINNILNKHLTEEDKQHIINYIPYKVYKIMKEHNMRLGQALCYSNPNKSEFMDSLFYFEDDKILLEYLNELIYK